MLWNRPFSQPCCQLGTLLVWVETNSLSNGPSKYSWSALTAAASSFTWPPQSTHSVLYFTHNHSATFYHLFSVLFCWNAHYFILFQPHHLQHHPTKLHEHRSCCSCMTTNKQTNKYTKKIIKWKHKTNRYLTSNSAEQRDRQRQAKTVSPSPSVVRWTKKRIIARRAGSDAVDSKVLESGRGGKVSLIFISFLAWLHFIAFLLLVFGSTSVQCPAEA